MDEAMVRVEGQNLLVPVPHLFHILVRTGAKPPKNIAADSLWKMAENDKAWTRVVRYS